MSDSPEGAAGQARRSFLKLLVRGAVYAAPVVTSFAVPSGGMAQGKSSQHKMGGGGGMMMMMMGMAAPFTAPPPGSAPPPGAPPPGSPPP